jgi:hypothetical protein
VSALQLTALHAGCKCVLSVLFVYTWYIIGNVTVILPALYRADAQNSLWRPPANDDGICYIIYAYYIYMMILHYMMVLRNMLMYSYTVVRAFSHR